MKPLFKTIFRGTCPNRLKSDFLSILLTLIFSAGVYGSDLSVIPRPVNTIVNHGQFNVNDVEQIVISGCQESANAAKMLRELICPVMDMELPVVTKQTVDMAKAIELKIVKGNEYGSEGYRFSTCNGPLTITANTGAGLFYGIETLRQLLPSEIELKQKLSTTKLMLPNVEIVDRPRFGWRGLMLDESRAFFGKKTVKKLLDRMALYKMNRFHWHLTDSPGWRIEIKQYPKLTEIGGIGTHADPYAKSQYYTQADIKEIVAYAAARHIVIIPEIDMPGHATAANRAYPEYSGGGSKKHPEFTFNPGNEATYQYLENILKEVAELFPGAWLHYGGDEASFGNKQWIDDVHVKRIMKDKGLADIEQVEHYFNKRMAKTIKGLGKVTVGWDEIVDAGVPAENAMIMWWRHNKPEQLHKLIERGYNVVLCPRIPCYFDFVQHESHKYGRRWKGFCDIDSVYMYPTFAKKYSSAQMEQIVGIQANVWTEQIQNVKRLDFMTFPRLAALAEAAWTMEENKDLTDFRKRLKPMLTRHDVMGDHYFNCFEPEKTPEPAGLKK